MTHQTDKCSVCASPCHQLQLPVQKFKLVKNVSAQAKGSQLLALWSITNEAQHRASFVCLCGAATHSLGLASSTEVLVCLAHPQIKACPPSICRMHCLRVDGLENDTVPIIKAHPCS